MLGRPYNTQDSPSQLYCLVNEKQSVKRFSTENRIESNESFVAGKYVAKSNFEFQRTIHTEFIIPVYADFGVSFV